MAEYFDTYFFDSKRAKSVAKKKHPIGNILNRIQLCYHNGSETNKNLVGVEVSNLKHFFLNTTLRFPTHIDFIGSIYEDKEEEQEKIVNIFYSLFQEINGEKNEYRVELAKQFKNLHLSKDKQKNIGFIASKTQPYIVDFFHLISKNIKQFSTKVLTQKSKNSMVLSDISIENVYKFILNFKPSYIFFYNEFYPQLIHPQIKHVYIIDSFKICERILDSNITKEDINNHMILFSTSEYYKKILMLRDIDSVISLPSYIENNVKVKVKTKKRKYTISLAESYHDISYYYIFEKMIKKIDKFLYKNILSIDKVIHFISKAKYPIKNDWELNLYIQKTLTVNHIVKHTKLNLNILGLNWDKIKHHHKIIKKKTFSELYKNSKYVVVVSYKLDDNNILDIIKHGAIPIVYNLKNDYKYYNNFIEDYCLYFSNLKELEDIINNDEQPNKRYDNELYKHFSMKNLVNIISKSL